MTVPTFTLAGTVKRTHGPAMVGGLSVKPDRVLRDVVGKVILAGPVPITPVGGVWQVDLPAPGPDVRPTSFSYTLSYDLDVSLDDLTFAAPAAGTTLYDADIETSATVDAPASIVGPQGVPGFPAGGRFVALGDSISTSGLLSAGGGGYGGAWPQLACALSMQRLSYGGNGGVSGQTSTEIAARVPDVLALKPRMVTVLAGTNDITQGDPLAKWQGNIKTIAAQLRAAGVRALLCTIPPRGNTTYLATTLEWNNWLRQYARDNAYDLLDFFAVLADPTTGMYKAGYNSGDNLHPHAAAHLALAQHVVSKVQTTAFEPIQARLVTDARNLLGNPLLTTGTPSPGSWIPAGGGTAAEVLITDDTDFDGKAWQIAFTAAANTLDRQLVAYSISPGAATYAAGDKLLFTFRNKITASTVTPNGVTGVWALVLFYGAASPVSYLLQGDTQVHGIALHQFEATVPDGTTSMQLVLSVTPNVGSNITTRLGNLGIYNLSKVAS